MMAGDEVEFWKESLLTEGSAWILSSSFDIERLTFSALWFCSSLGAASFLHFEGSRILVVFKPDRRRCWMVANGMHPPFKLPCTAHPSIKQETPMIIVDLR
jgi:hypothetical protein